MGLSMYFRPLRGILTKLPTLPKEVQEKMLQGNGKNLPGCSLYCWMPRHGNPTEGYDPNDVLIGYEEEEHWICRIHYEGDTQYFRRKEHPMSQKDWTLFSEQLPKYLHGERESFDDYFLFWCF
ncbi:hypothetical protein CAOG_07251 [Capsaspora owczarzaki ATCC 30864]|uniref:Uncharacterized protein n=1 Tax=Capsaspora owczarzaki (strain ATCC 30864) TaxID=595528 RepID=A0A0D2WWL5_CAPO3|nr:hypothetical protein CAOG_07251 [Capsaspora owczarzaki ATCC 30864]KJE97380.1 hypothetical protein CAOG_007251 [Capsaspora owczarzaki ATCC 30864]|eukprot:XP_004343110.1 hypothetical protein CAOG_07251 [Capsaspora owczarzaki ATCC 30864]